MQKIVGWATWFLPWFHLAAW